jgi:hypothetical protein
MSADAAAHAAKRQPHSGESAEYSAARADLLELTPEGRGTDW